VIAWLLSSWIGQLAAVVFAAWFLRGLWKATMRPRLTYISSSFARKEHERREYLVSVKRQELLPPWRTLEETWLVVIAPKGTADWCAREGDGKFLPQNDKLSVRLRALVRLAKARESETEELLKAERRPN
jgi:hypothetical protein